MKAPRRAMAAVARPVDQPTRCAIYTRKSTDEGLDQDFNSLDAQRLAAENFVKSQQSEGWVVLPDRYDDGGCSGANMERAGLKRLLTDVEAGRINTVLVYKLDRLSRSMPDSLKMFEIFEAHGVAFVSVTQAFNTATPVGRMFMNILLSFGQFEREQTAERTRDKVHAARRKGLFTGGLLPLGYDRHPDGGKLVLNQREAQRVRAIFDLFLEKQALVETVQELSRRGWTLKRWITKPGKQFGGGDFDAHSLRRLLTNPVYIAEVHFDSGVYGAEHEAIIDREVWGRARALINDGAKRPRYDSARPPKAPLAGLLRCAACDAAMTPSYSQKSGRRWRYYICHKAHRRGWSTCPAPSLPAGQIERFVVDRIRAIGTDPELVAATLEEARRHAGPGIRVQAADLRKALAEFAAVWGAMTTFEQAQAAQALIERIDYDGRTKDINIVFTAEGVRLLVVQGDDA